MKSKLNTNMMWQHQKDAINSIVKEAKNKERTQVVMACGSGKTLVGLQYAIRSKARNILVLLPSLGLMKQTLDYWIKNSSWNIDDFMCVCSDKKVVDYDGVNIIDDELPCYVSTNTSEVRKFIGSKRSEYKIVFATYQSGDVVAKAMPKSFKFDLGIFDEAHKTAGSKNKHFALALDNKNIKISFRLFMTATPKHYNVTNQAKGDNRKLAFSMDDADIYGDVCYKFSFADAVEQGVICDYKIIISVIDNSELDRFKLMQSKANIEDGAIEARQIAHRAALSYALKKHPVNKIISFHSTVKDAEEFSHYQNAKYFKNIEGFNMFHVNGRMPSDNRQSLIEEFRTSKKSLLSNARCLTEGIDVPNVDCVAFLHPKKSSVDVIQAVGRAMRRSKGKQCGYVFIPLYLNKDQNEDIKKVSQITGFDCVVKILNALKEVDSSLEQVLTEALASSVKHGKHNLSKLNSKIIIECNSNLEASNIERAISTEIISNLVSSWEQRYEELKKYKDEKGDCNVPSVYPENQKLAGWVLKQRGHYKKGELPKKEIDMLESIGFIWDSKKAMWLKRYKELLEYERINGDCDVPSVYPENQKLANWIHHQRKSFRRGVLDNETIDLLNKVNFIWNRPEFQWNLGYKELEKFYSIEGHSNVSRSYKKGFPLGAWCNDRRMAFKQGKLSPQRIKLLEKLNFKWMIRPCANKNNNIRGELCGS
jgi:predicted helicase